MTPRPNVSEMRKTQILDAAEDVFTKKGFADARMDDIADHTGLSKGALYLYFRSKDEMIIAILDRIFQGEFRRLENLDWSSMGAAESLHMFIDMAMKDISAMLRLMPMAYEFMSMAFRNRYVQEAFRRYLGRYLAILTPLVQAGIDSGEFRPVNAGEVAIAIGAIIEGTILLWVYDHSVIEPERHIRSGVQVLLHGLLRHD